jgi:hypothetical protein
MALALVGYFGTMLTALAAFMMLLNAILGSSPLEKTKPQPHPRPEFAQMRGPEKKPEQQWNPSVARATLNAGTRSSEVTGTTAAAPPNAERIKRRRVARQPRHKLLARDRDERGYATALGYGQEPMYGRTFGPFGPGRF